MQGRHTRLPKPYCLYSFRCACVPPRVSLSNKAHAHLASGWQAQNKQTAQDTTTGYNIQHNNNNKLFSVVTAVLEGCTV